jgi:hypothetical protein
MAYDRLATSEHPALIVYVLDVSASMSQPLGSKRRIDVVADALQAAFTRLIFRSTKGARVAPAIGWRYWRTATTCTICSTA